MNRSILAIFFWLLSTPALSAEIKMVNWGTDLWKDYTDKDGSGIYTQLLTKVFAMEGVGIQATYMPFARTLHLVRINKLDFAGGIPKDKQSTREYIQSKYPIGVARFKVFFKRNAVEAWQGIRTLEGKRIVATPHQAEQAGVEEQNVYVVETREQALQMLLNNRADFYLDNETVLKNIIEANRATFDVDDYREEVVGTSGYYMIAPNTERGRAIMDIYERGTLKLYRTGELKALYDKFGFTTPKIGE